MLGHGILEKQWRVPSPRRLMLPSSGAVGGRQAHWASKAFLVAHQPKRAAGQMLRAGSGGHWGLYCLDFPLGMLSDSQFSACKCFASSTICPTW